MWMNSKNRQVIEGKNKSIVNRLCTRYNGLFIGKNIFFSIHSDGMLGYHVNKMNRDP